MLPYTGGRVHGRGHACFTSAERGVGALNAIGPLALDAAMRVLPDAAGGDSEIREKKMKAKKRRCKGTIKEIGPMCVLYIFYHESQSNQSSN